MYRHLVTVKVGVKRGTYQRMQLNGFTFNQDRFKRLNTQTVQGRRTVQHNRMFADDLIQNIPYYRHFLFDQFFGRLHGGGFAAQFQLMENKRFEQLQGHFFRQTALVQTQVWAYGNHGTTGVVHTFTQQVLTETTALTFNHVCQRFQRTFVGTGHGFTATAVIQQRVNRFLQHTFFVADNDVRSVQFQQAFQTIVTIDDATV